MSKNATMPRPQFFGVGCESCHGPGRAHIAAVKTHAPDLRMERLARVGARDLNQLCGKCHQTEQTVASASLLAKMTFRFQPYALMRSRCFRESGERLSCLNCHDAHTDASPGPESYTSTCLSCHSSTPRGGQMTGVAPSGSPAGKVCPVNAKSNCVTCHMPKRDMLSTLGETSNIYMTEHLIGIYSNGALVSHQ